jgi:hypothetical protein
MATQNVNKRALSATLQSAQTTGNGTAVKTLTASDTGVREHTIYIIGSAGVSAGAVQFETATTSDYAGTWAPLGAAVTVGSDTTQIVQVTGALLWIRARISTNIANGTVTVEYVGN